ncbi:hypothetical protein Pth03_60610 [Planotetraspora thailandica]|uniref:Uncharacterized protein n=1 Tax=Planotetraspora thailandica TaxID=487172 RepID=A0A8J3V8X8_9ACTN|nr:hypothetical protein [Planotetraspora thailandica]GII57672.1 hypothetical protein Pth03_60610 [Planotetraspora thailandica]
MHGKRLSLSLGAALLAALTLGSAQVAQASSNQPLTKTVVSAPQGESNARVATSPPGPDDRHRRHHRERHHRHERHHRFHHERRHHRFHHEGRHHRHGRHHERMH